MSATVKLSLEQLAPWMKDGFEGALKRIDWSRPLKVISIMLSSSTKENFDQAKTPDGIPWKPLKQPRRRSKGWGEDDRPLRDTGLLMGSVTGGNEQHYESFNGTLLEWGTNVHYAPVHQFGARIQRPGKSRPTVIPARPFLPFVGEHGDDEELKEEITEYLADEIADQLMNQLQRG